MLILEQEKWVAHLSDEHEIRIIPFDPTAEEKFQKVKQRIQDVLGGELSVEHRGATSLGISGQDEIDIYIPVPANKFDTLVKPLTGLFGKPGSLYPLQRARFETEQGGKHVTVFLMNSECRGWIDGVKFEDYLKSHAEALEAYRELKEKGNGLSTREYYRRKIEFINEVLSAADLESRFDS